MFSEILEVKIEQENILGTKTEYKIYIRDQNEIFTSFCHYFFTTRLQCINGINHMDFVIYPC